MNAPAESMQRRLTQARRLLAIAQTGLHYTTGAFDRERYQELLGIAQAQLAEVAEISTEEIVQLFSREEGYANPEAGRALRGASMTRVAHAGDSEARQMASGRFLGGWVDIGASPAENAMREVWEESCYTVTIDRFLAVRYIYNHNQPPSVIHIRKLLFLWNNVSSGDISGVETDAVEFFPIDALPPLSEGRVLPEQIRRLSELRANGGMEFD